MPRSGMPCGQPKFSSMPSAPVASISGRMARPGRFLAGQHQRDDQRAVRPIPFDRGDLAQVDLQAAVGDQLDVVEADDFAVLAVVRPNSATTRRPPAGPRPASSTPPRPSRPRRRAPRCTPCRSGRRGRARRDSATLMPEVDAQVGHAAPRCGRDRCGWPARPACRAGPPAPSGPGPAPRNRRRRTRRAARCASRIDHDACRRSTVPGSRASGRRRRPCRLADRLEHDVGARCRWWRRCRAGARLRGGFPRSACRARGRRRRAALPAARPRCGWRTPFGLGDIDLVAGRAHRVEAAPVHQRDLVGAEALESAPPCRSPCCRRRSRWRGAATAARRRSLAWRSVGDVVDRGQQARRILARQAEAAAGAAGPGRGRRAS